MFGLHCNAKATHSDVLCGSSCYKGSVNWAMKYQSTDSAGLNDLMNGSVSHSVDFRLIFQVNFNFGGNLGTNGSICTFQAGPWVGPTIARVSYIIYLELTITIPEVNLTLIDAPLIQRRTFR